MLFRSVVYATDASLKLYKEIQGDNEEEELDCVITDNAGNSIFDYGYRDSAVSQDGYSAMVCDQDGTWTNVNLSNQLLAKNEDRAYEKIGSLSAENIATAVLDGKYRFVNSELKMWEIEWDDAATFSNGINAVCKDGKWAIVTATNWQRVETYPYVDVARNRYDYVMTAGRIVAADGQGYLLLDQDLNPVGEQH